MKSLKLAAFALAFGIFAASCGGNKEAEAPTTDTATEAPAPEPQPEVAPTPAPTDTTAAKTEVAPVADTTKK